MAKRAVMSMLPFELIVEILSWLPAKSLLRFKCVDKTWHSVISDPEFAKVQVSRSTDRRKLLVTTSPPQSIDYETFEARKLNDPAPLVTDDCGDPFYSIIGSCNGLVCVFDLIGDHLMIWNPTTGICSQIPNPNAALYCILLVGMGYNHSTDDYGVIFGSRYTSNGTKDAIIELYTRKTRAWKRIEVFDLDPESFCSSSGLYWKDDLHYLTVKGSGYDVVCFDMVEERFKVISPLPNTGTYFRAFGFVVYKNNMCVFIDHNKSSFECLMLKMEGNKVSFNRLFRYPHAKYSLCGINGLCLTKNGEVVMDSGGWELNLYVPSKTKVTRVFGYTMIPMLSRKCTKRV